MSHQGQPYQAFGEEEEDVFDGDMNFGVQGDYEGTYNEAESGKSELYYGTATLVQLQERRNELQTTRRSVTFRR